VSFSLSSKVQDEAAAVAYAIANSLCDSAIRYRGRCTWLGPHQQGNSDEDARFTHAPIAADVYDGTAGIALFLAEVAVRDGEPRVRDTAIAAARSAMAACPSLPRAFQYSYFTGVLGHAHALYRVGRLLDRDDFLRHARRELKNLSSQPVADGALLDVISGAAGAMTPLLSLSRNLYDDSLIDLAIRLGDRILASAQRSDAGWSWDSRATGFHSPRALTGFGHGAAGIGWGLAELYAETGESRFAEAARQAFRYESGEFIPECDNWPDYRFTDGESSPAPCGVAWCFGAPGIGLARRRAVAIVGDVDGKYERDVDAVLRAIAAALAGRENIADDDYSLCHGWGGVAEFLAGEADGRAESSAKESLARIILEGAARHGHEAGGWQCGLVRGSSPSLMLGVAGIGYFYLRMSDGALPSVLAVAATT